MSYLYHSQRQADSFAKEILPVPEDYPLNPVLPENYREHFVQLCELAKRIYLDMVKEPQAYGLALLPIDSADHNLARDSYRSIYRFVETLNALFANGEVADHSLRVDTAKFRKGIKSPVAITGYGLILSKLCDFGFTISDFNGSMIARGAESFLVEYPDDPEMINTIKAYCDCWAEVDRFRGGGKKRGEQNELVKLSPQEFHHHFYRFDYKITADLSKLPMLTWVRDEADIMQYGPKLKEFSIVFFEEMQSYSGVLFNGDYMLGGKRIARITNMEYPAVGAKYMLILKLRSMDKYIDFVEKLPDAVKEPFTKSCCQYCGFQGSTKEYCKFRLHWTLDGEPHDGCVHQCFHFSAFNMEYVPVYAKLLELEYGLKQIWNQRREDKDESCGESSYFKPAAKHSDR